jgi:hypothetical protein
MSSGAVSKPPRRAWLAGAAAALLVGLVPAGCAGKSEHERAIDDAADGARIQARTAASQLQKLLRGPDAPRREADLTVLDGIVDNGYLIGTVFGRSLAPDGTISADIEFHDVGHALKEEAIARICVRLAGVPGPAAEVAIADVVCAADLPSHIPGMGEVDRVVPFAP